MELKHIKGNSYCIETLATVGVYVNGNNATLIDSGLDREEASLIDETLLENNLTLTGIIITHSHADHIGGCKYFQDKYGVKVLSTVADTAIANISIMNTSLIYGGMPSNIAKGKMLYAESCKAEQITLKNLPKGLSIVDLKGHSISMIGVLTDDNVLYCADSLVSEKTINKFPLTYVLDVEQYFQSMDKLLEIKADYYCPSHSDVTTNLTKLVEFNKNAVKQNIVDILECITEPLELNDIVDNFCKNVGTSLKKSQFFVITSTIKNYLAYLEKINMVETYIKDNRLYFVKKTD